MLRVIRKLLQIFTEKQKRKIGLLMIIMLIGGALESVGVSLILPLITALMDSTDWQGSFWSEAICAVFRVSDQKSYVEILLVLLIVVFVGKNVFLIWEYNLQYGFICNCRYNMQRDLMDSFMHKPYDYYLKSSSGEIIRIITNDTGQVTTLLITVMTFMTEMIAAVVLAITIVIISPLIAFIISALLILELLIITHVIKPLMRRAGERYRSNSALANKWILQGINGIKTVKVSGTEEFFVQKYNGHADKVADMERKNYVMNNLPRLLIEAFTMTGVLLVLLIRVIMGGSVMTLLPQISAFAVAAVRLLPSANRISSSLNSVPYYEGSLDNIIIHLNKQNDKSRLFPKKPFEESQRVSFQNVLKMEKVTFSYNGAKTNILEDVCMEIKPGQSVGIVGPSGAGKTTAVDLLLGLLSPVAGTVEADGVDIERDISGWRSRLAYVPQNIFLMDDTIKANVAFGKPLEEVSDDEIWSALRDAQLEEFVKALPNGLHTSVGEQGVRLSGGQRQRIGIARALFTNPDIIVFDEATSALDIETETAIMESINRLKGQKTLIIIAHRLSTIENCDCVYRVENGKITLES